MLAFIVLKKSNRGIFIKSEKKLVVIILGMNKYESNQSFANIFLYIPLEKISWSLYFEDMVTILAYVLKNNDIF